MSSGVRGAGAPTEVGLGGVQVMVLAQRCGTSGYERKVGMIGGAVSRRCGRATAVGKAAKGATEPERSDGANERNEREAEAVKGRRAISTMKTKRTTLGDASSNAEIDDGENDLVEEGRTTCTRLRWTPCALLFYLFPFRFKRSRGRAYLGRKHRVQSHRE